MKGVDFGETFAHIIKFKSVRIVLALVAHLDLEMNQMDIVTAFSNDDNEEDLYIEVPEGARCKDNEGLVYKIQRALYGLKQAPKS